MYCYPAVYYSQTQKTGLSLIGLPRYEKETDILLIILLHYQL